MKKSIPYIYNKFIEHSGGFSGLKLNKKAYSMYGKNKEDCINDERFMLSSSRWFLEDRVSEINPYRTRKASIDLDKKITEMLKKHANSFILPGEE